MNLDWRVIAAIPPTLVWFVLFAYLAKVDARVKKAEERFK